MNALAGYYSPNRENVEILCPGGKDCTNANSITDCPTGYVSEEGRLECVICDAGWACPRKELAMSQQIDCAKVRGYYQNAGQGQTECLPCPAGQYCPYGDIDPHDCDDGQFSLGASEFCHTCPPGYACPHKDKPLLEPCLTGTYSFGKQNACTTCEANFECVGAYREECDANKWSSEGEGMCKFFGGGLAGYDTTTHNGSGVA